MKRVLVVLILAASCSAQTPPAKHPIPWGEIALIGINIGATSADLSLTHKCLSDGTCYEANPMMPNSAAGQAAIAGSLSLSQIMASHKLRKQGNKFWWLPLVGGTAWHAAGIGSVLAK